MQEASRVIRSDGSVVKNMSNGDVVVLYADGGVSNLTGVTSGVNILQRAESPVRSSSARSGREQAATPTRKGIGVACSCHCIIIIYLFGVVTSLLLHRYCRLSPHRNYIFVRSCHLIVIT